MIDMKTMPSFLKDQKPHARLRLLRSDNTPLEVPRRNAYGFPMRRGRLFTLWPVVVALAVSAAGVAWAVWR